jgi:hypothetical protein
MAATGFARWIEVRESCHGKDVIGRNDKRGAPIQTASRVLTLSDVVSDLSDYASALIDSVSGYPDSASALSDNVSGLPDSMSAVTDNVSGLSDNMSAFTD